MALEEPVGSCVIDVGAGANRRGQQRGVVLGAQLELTSEGDKGQPVRARALAELSKVAYGFASAAQVQRAKLIVVEYPNLTRRGYRAGCLGSKRDGDQSQGAEQGGNAGTAAYEFHANILPGGTASDR